MEDKHTNLEILKRENKRLRGLVNILNPEMVCKCCGFEGTVKEYDKHKCELLYDDK